MTKDSEIIYKPLNLFCAPANNRMTAKVNAEPHIAILTPDLPDVTKPPRLKASTFFRLHIIC